MNRMTFRLALRNLGRNLNRNLATGFAVSFGFIAIIVSASYNSRIEYLVRQASIYGSRLGHITITPPGGFKNSLVDPASYSIDRDQQIKIEAAISSVKNLDFYAPYLVGTGLVGNGCASYPYVLNAYPSDYLHRVRNTEGYRKFEADSKVWVKGQELSEVPPQLNGVAIADGLSRILKKNKMHLETFTTSNKPASLDCTPGNTEDSLSADSNLQLAGLDWQGEFTAGDAEIVSIYKGYTIDKNDSEIIAPLDLAQKLYNTDRINGYTVYLKDVDPLRLTNIVKELKEKLSSAGVSVDVFSWDDESINHIYRQVTDMMGGWFLVIGLVVFGIVALSISNSATITVMERSQEIGMLRSMGYSQSRIRELFLTENLLLTVVAMLCGAVLAAIVIRIHNQFFIPVNLPATTTPVNFKMQPAAVDLIVAALFAVFMSIFATTVAVWSFSRQNIVSLLYKVRS